MATYDEILSRMYDSYTELTGISPDDASDIAVRFKALAAQLALLSGEVRELSAQSFPATASGEYLELHAAARGLTRKSGSCAAGVLTFSRENAASYEIPIPAGTVCQTTGEEPVRFVTDAAVTLPANTLSVDTTATAQDPGSAGNILAGQATVMVNPPAGITAAGNRAAFYGGTDPETDAQLRARIAAHFAQISNGCNEGFFLSLALGYPGIASAAVLPLERGANTVDVVVYGAGEPPTAAVLAGLQAEIDARRTLGVSALVRAATAVVTDVALAVSPAAGYSATTAQTEAAAAVRIAFAACGVGTPQALARLLAAVMDCDAVRNCHITAPAADLYPLDDHIFTAGSVTAAALEVS